MFKGHASAVPPGALVWVACAVLAMTCSATTPEAQGAASGSAASQPSAAKHVAGSLAGGAHAGGQMGAAGSGTVAIPGAAGTAAAGQTGAAGSGAAGRAGGTGNGASTDTARPAANSGNDGGAGGNISEWRQASLTNFTSYPDPASDECVKYNGCTWAGQFAGIDGKQTLEWVTAHNIAAVHAKDFNMYGLKTLRLRKGGKEIDVTVYDECADSDCSGCCTQNAKPSGFLIDIEKYTAERFGVSDGQVEWACLDCK
jgi:hypothetical protein